MSQFGYHYSKATREGIAKQAQMSFRRQNAVICKCIGVDGEGSWFSGLVITVHQP